MPYGNICCTYHQLKYSTPNRSKEKQNKSLPLGKWRFIEKEVGEWANSRKGYDRKSNRTRQKNKRGDIEKWDHTESPEIPDRGETSETTGLVGDPTRIMDYCDYKHKLSITLGREREVCSPVCSVFVFP